MIALKKLDCPLSLTDQVVRDLTKKYKTDRTSVWKRVDISKQLLASSHSKCIYCECLLNEESKYMEIDHFRHKDKFPDQVVDWKNLVPSCKKCNTSKGTHNTQAVPIVNPFEVDPREHLDFKYYRFVGRDGIGKDTISVVSLNDLSHHTKPRFRIGEQIYKNVEGLIERLENARNPKNTGKQNVIRFNKLNACLSSLLDECQPKSTYAATAATILFDHPEWPNIVKDLRELGHWNKELQNKFEGAQRISYVEII